MVRKSLVVMLSTLFLIECNSDPKWEYKKLTSGPKRTQRNILNSDQNKKSYFDVFYESNGLPSIVFENEYFDTTKRQISFDSLGHVHSILERGTKNKLGRKITFKSNGQVSSIEYFETLGLFKSKQLSGGILYDDKFNAHNSVIYSKDSSFSE